MSDPKIRIIKAAEVMFADHGFDGLTIRELADELDVNVATIHYHYGSKRELYGAAVTRSVRRQRAPMERMLERYNELGDMTLKEFTGLLDRFVDDVLQTTNAHPWSARIFIRSALTRGTSDPLFDQAPGEPVIPQLQEVLDRAAKQELIEPANAATLGSGLAWTVYGYFVSRTKHAKERLKPPDLQQLHTQLRRYLFGTLKVPLEHS